MDAKTKVNTKTKTPSERPARKIAVRKLDKIETTGLTGGDN